jgi:hypothetical protein
MLTRANDVGARLREMQDAFMASLAGLGSASAPRLGSGSAVGVVQVRVQVQVREEWGCRVHPLDGLRV